MKNRLFKKWEVLLALSILIIGGILIIPKVVSAADESETWILPKEAYNGNQELKSSEGTKIVQRGTHPRGTSSILYRTSAYYMTLQKVGETYTTAGAFSTVDKQRIPVKVEDNYDGDIVITTYTMLKTDFFTAMRNLGVTSKMFRDQGGSITVYIQNEFEIFNPNKEGEPAYKNYTNILGYQDMINAGDKITGYNGGWSSDSRESLRYYYNFPYVITPTLFNVKVVAAAEINGKLTELSTIRTGDSGMINEQYPISGKVTAPDTCSYNGTKYTFKDYYYCRYYPRTDSTKLTQGPTITGKIITGYTLPDAVKESTVTFYMIYEPVEDEPNPNTLYYIYDGKSKKVCELDEKKAGEKVTWSSQVSANPVKNIFPTGTSFNLQGYYIQAKVSGTKLSGTTSLYTKDGAKESKITGGSATVVKGGLNVYILYSSDDTPPPTPTLTPTPTPTAAPSSTPIPTPTPFPEVAPVEVPEPQAPKTLSLDSPAPEGIINGDPYTQPYFLSKAGISTTESQYVIVRTKDYLLGYRLVNRTGKLTYQVPVTMHTQLTYNSATPKEFGGPVTVSTDHTYTQYINVERAYSYWEIESLEYFAPDTATISNYSLPGGSVQLSANRSYMDVPTLITSHSSTVTSHVIPPSEVSTGIQVYGTPIVTEDTSMPVVTPIDLSYYALTQTGETTVKNDYISFDGKVVMSNISAQKIAPAPNVASFIHCTTVTQDKAFFTENRVIDAEKLNGDYQSGGTVTYQRNSYSVSTGQTAKTYSVSVNSVTVHTPVICQPVIAADNDEWVQLLKPTNGAVEIVLDTDTSLNDFTVRISNTLQHSPRLGYYTRDFSRSFIDPENVSYIAKKDGIVRNEMKLPFDVYLDTSADNILTNDKFIKAGTWIILGRNTYRFYVPMWVQEGIYTAQFRTIAVNGKDKLDLTETTRNSYINNYVATATQTFEISGRMYGLTMYDISDDIMWKEVFRVNQSTQFKLFNGYTDGTKLASYGKDYAYSYTVGMNNRYGLGTGRLSRYTVPLVNGSHPRWKNQGILKTGYAVRFYLDTIGEMYSGGCMVKITPTFYYVDKNGENRKQVDLYYSEEIKNKNYNLIKVGAGLDLVNIKKGTTGNPYSRIPAKEIKNTANVMNTTYSRISNQIDVMYSYSQIRLTNAFRMFIGTDYAATITGLSSWSEVQNNTGQTQTDLSKYIQRWYGTYRIPMDVHVVASGYDVTGYMKKYGIDYTESFWLKDGYIIVNFNVVTIDKNGKEHLSYINADNYLHNNNCSMWVTEGGILQKTNRDGTTFNFKAGDFVIYYTDKKFSDDYQGNLY